MERGKRGGVYCAKALWEKRGKGGCVWCHARKRRGRDAEKPFPLLLLRMSKRGCSSGGERESGTELPREEKVCRPSDPPTEGSSRNRAANPLLLLCST